MTQIGEGVAAPSKAEAEALGRVALTVVDRCAGDPIEGARVVRGRRTFTTGSAGSVSLPELQPGDRTFRVFKHYEDCDYVTIAATLPIISKNLSRRHRAEVSGTVEVPVPAGAEAKARLELDLLRLCAQVVFKRLHVGLRPLNYGHWWVEVGAGRSYGWWPTDLAKAPTDPPEPPPPVGEGASVAEQIQGKFDAVVHQARAAAHAARQSVAGQYAGAILNTFKGVPGILNGNEDFKRAERDPHHGEAGEEEYSPVIDDCRSDPQIAAAIREFAFGYSGEWSWRLEFGQNCHSFQTKLIKDLRLEKLKPRV